MYLYVHCGSSAEPAPDLIRGRPPVTSAAVVPRTIFLMERWVSGGARDPHVPACTLPAPDLDQEGGILIGPFSAFLGGFPQGRNLAYNTPLAAMAMSSTVPV